ncbi:MAG: Excinuclease subunit domain protein [Firmicutes bacterium]|nr:Excinuclease subunit domain protein [Bacillota bacterium]
MIAFTYIVECADGTLYTGWTVDVEKRVLAHNTKRGAKYTRNRLPVKIVYVESFSSKIEAQQREYAIKQLNRAEKLKLISARLHKTVNIQ